MGKVTKRFNGGIQYQATFYDADGNPLSNQEVYFEVDDKDDYSATTDANGVALLNIAVKNGDHKIVALCTDPLGVNQDNIKVFNVLTGNKNFKMYLTSFKNKAAKKSIKFKVKFLGKNKKNKKIKVKFNKKTYKAKTNKKGIAVFKLKTPKKLGSYKIVVSYKKSKITATYAKYYM